MATTDEPTRDDSSRERCARCGLPVVAWRVEVGGLVYCTSYCARVAPPADAREGGARDGSPP